MKTFKLILFCLIFWLTFIFGYDALAGNKHANRKQHREYANRADKCRAAQYEIQSSNQTKYKKHNSWQPRSVRKKAIRS